MGVIDRDGVVDRFRELDRAVEGRFPGARCRVIVIGGAALMLKGLAGAGRATGCIDFLEAPFEAVASMAGLDMDNAAETFAYGMPTGMRSRLEDAGLGLDSVDVPVPSDADLAVTRLISGGDAGLRDALDARRPPGARSGDPGAARRPARGRGQHRRAVVGRGARVVGGGSRWRVRGGTGYAPI